MFHILVVDVWYELVESASTGTNPEVQRFFKQHAGRNHPKTGVLQDLTSRCSYVFSSMSRLTTQVSHLFWPSSGVVKGLFTSHLFSGSSGGGSPAARPVGRCGGSQPTSSEGPGRPGLRVSTVGSIGGGEIFPQLTYGKLVNLSMVVVKWDPPAIKLQFWRIYTLYQPFLMKLGMVRYWFYNMIVALASKWAL